MHLRGFEASYSISGGAGVHPQVLLFHLMDIVQRPIKLYVLKPPEESCPR